MFAPNENHDAGAIIEKFEEDKDEIVDFSDIQKGYINVNLI